ncbi:hypothetical protein ALQ15_200079 [Pseudomonas syringae pv. actinidiae]|nr:hypothetical protein ALQ15_200079 [Pseudomonas syringae pv. actinidiae]
MRVMIQGRALIDNWTKEGKEFSALKVQASRVAILPHRVEAVQLAPSQSYNQPQSEQQNTDRSSTQNDAAPHFDDDIPV